MPRPYKWSLPFRCSYTEVLAAAYIVSLDPFLVKGSESATEPNSGLPKAVMWTSGKRQGISIAPEVVCCKSRPGHAEAWGACAS
jgi:hypothetical protein